MPIPDAFLTRLAKIVPESLYDSVLTSFSVTRRTGFRLNTLLGTRNDIMRELEKLSLDLEKVSWYPDAFSVPESQREVLLQSELYRNGLVYVQNHSSMVPPLVLSPVPGERVLDLTAAPGSKTLQMAALAGSESEIAAVEVVRKRFFKLRDNLKQNGAPFVRTFLQDGTKVWRYRPEYFDCVLLDAPCSSEARFRVDDPDSYAYWSERKVREMARKQQRLVYSAIKALKPGGRLVYSTCSFSPEENEMVLDRALKMFPDAIEVLPVNLPVPNFSAAIPAWKDTVFNPQIGHAKRILPDDSMEGFFVALLHKSQSVD